MYFGSDDEKAITKSIQDVFPSATRRLYSKHLKDLNHYIQDKIGIDTKQRQHLMNVVFGQDGLTNCDLHSQNCCWSIVVDRILSGCDGVHVQMTGFEEDNSWNDDFNRWDLLSN
jgi:hypothetical protein